MKCDQCGADTEVIDSRRTRFGVRRRRECQARAHRMTTYERRDIDIAEARVVTELASKQNIENVRFHLRAALEALDESKTPPAREVIKDLYEQFKQEPL